MAPRTAIIFLLPSPPHRGDLLLSKGAQTAPGGCRATNCHDKRGGDLERREEWLVRPVRLSMRHAGRCGWRGRRAPGVQFGPASLLPLLPVRRPGPQPTKGGFCRLPIRQVYCHIDREPRARPQSGCKNIFPVCCDRHGVGVRGAADARSLAPQAKGLREGRGGPAPLFYARRALVFFCPLPYASGSLPKRMGELERKGGQPVR